VSRQPLDGEATDRVTCELHDLMRLRPCNRDESRTLLVLGPRSVVLLDVGTQGGLKQREQKLDVFGRREPERNLFLHQQLSRSAIGEPTRTSAPGWTNWATRRPDTGDGTSMVALSVSTSRSA
jgi:hypothetical protein